MPTFGEKAHLWRDKPFPMLGVCFFCQNKWKVYILELVEKGYSLLMNLRKSEALLFYCFPKHTEKDKSWEAC